MGLNLKEFFEKTVQAYKKHNNPETVKKRLKEKIEITKLKMEADNLNEERRNKLKKRYEFGGFQNGNK